jgi:hypothetical protein
MLYSDEVWTGIEYQVAAHLIYEGMVREGMAIVRGARERYDGRPRPPLPRNPWNEIECGGHYARAMSSWSLLLAATGYQYDAPRKQLTFAPRVTPDRIRAFFCGPEGWGIFAQTRKDGVQTDQLSVAHGKLAISQLTLQTVGTVSSAVVKVNGRTVRTSVKQEGDSVTLTFGTPLTLAASEKLAVQLNGK